jgi:putative redox protein
MEIHVSHLGAVQFEIKARHLTILSDQPFANGGFDEGMTPPELLLAALGSCAGYYAAQYLKKQGLAEEGTTVRVHADKVPSPARLDHFQIEVNAPVPLTERQTAELEKEVERCLVHNTLTHPPSINLEIRTIVSVARD